MKWVLVIIIIALFFTIGICVTAIGSVSIDSVSTISSKCTNNGQATVFAVSNPSGPLFYAIVSGPSLTGIQNNTTFSSLFPGNYTVRVYNSSFDSTETQFQITGNYQLPNFTVTGIDATCPSSTDGSITVNPDNTFVLV